MEPETIAALASAAQCLLDADEATDDGFVSDNIGMALDLVKRAIRGALGPEEAVN